MWSLSESCRNVTNRLLTRHQRNGLGILCAIGAVLTGGCDNSNAVVVRGEVLLDGRPGPAEIQIEQLDDDGHRVGQAGIAYADEYGRFSQTIERASGQTGPFGCRLIVRIPELSNRGLPSSLDETSSGEKVVRMKRIIQDDAPLNLVLTR